MADEDSFDTSDESQVSERRKKGGLKQLQDSEDLRLVLSTRGGRRFVWKLLSDCGLLEDHPPGLLLERFMGRRQVGLRVFRDVEAADPSAYVRMSEEARDG